MDGRGKVVLGEELAIVVGFVVQREEDGRLL